MISMCFQGRCEEHSGSCSPGCGLDASVGRVVLLFVDAPLRLQDLHRNCQDSEGFEDFVFLEDYIVIGL
jgi:hypothetical protein